MGTMRQIIRQAAILLVVACGRTADAPPNPDTTAVPAAPAPDSSAALTVSERGIGPLRAGATLADANAALGGALVARAGGDGAGCDYAEWRGGPAGVHVMTEQGRIARVDVDSGRIATAAGVRVGDDEARVQQLYPRRVTTTPHKYEAKGRYLTVRDAADSAYALVFETVNGKVVRYRAGRRPAVEYVERCG